MATFGTREDSVSYHLFPNLSKQNSSLSEILAKYTDSIGHHLLSYIWQQESFSLKIDNSNDCLVGSTQYGDNVEDEWFIVFLLLELTKEDPDLVVKVEDSDGEFLLFEVADYLPKWVDPETAVNRVYLYQGQLHLVPRSLVEGDLSEQDGVAAVRSQPGNTLASPKIQEALLARIQGYPSKMFQFHHQAHCYVPHAIASILKQDRSLLSAAVQAFYLRDPISMKVCKAMKYFPPETRVMTEVTFTRCLYAQLMKQEYTPPPTVGWNLPPPKSPQFTPHDLGMKLACGFELLAADAPRPGPEDVSPEDLCAGPRWTKFLDGLKDRNFFRGEIEGSRLYQERLAQAKSFFTSSLATQPSVGDVRDGVSDRLHRLLANLAHSYEELKQAEVSLPAPDDDGWLNMTQEELEELLTRQFGTANLLPEKKTGETIVNTLKTFMSQTGDLDGAEVPTQTGPVSFDPENFMETVKSMLDFYIPGEDDGKSSSDNMSGYTDDEEDGDHLGEKDPMMEQYMEQMDRELQGTTLAQSFDHQPKTESSKEENQEEGVDDEDDEFRPVDIDLTALKNILESYSSQHGLPGPASNLFGMMGVPLPPNK